ncbi:uncharacterized protein [Dendrobates tinctorius]|uniref:uncharacterized protein n=1 Tax=Dendrobates tinctorius TaxID=92724 RepID=UPI003CC99A7D
MFSEIDSALEDVMRRWRSIRDQYRRERQQRSRSGDAGHLKRKYIYYDRLSFLAPILVLRPTQSNLTERGTGSDTEPIIDPGSVGDEVAGPSSPPPRSMSEESSQENPVPVPQTPPPGPSAAAPSAIQEEQGNMSSSPTAQIRRSPQPAGPSRRGRRRRQIPVQDTRTNVDTGVLNYLARVNNDDGEEAYSHSLALYLHGLSREVRLHIRGCFQILLDASTHPNTPYELFEYLERWQLSPRNLMCLRPHTCLLKQALRILKYVGLHLTPFLPLPNLPNSSHICLALANPTNMATCSHPVLEAGPYLVGDDMAILVGMRHRPTRPNKKPFSSITLASTKPNPRRQYTTHIMGNSMPHTGRCWAK